MSREDRFFKLSTTLPYPERSDERDESSVPELANVVELYESGSAQGAIEYGSSLMKMYPDNDLIPYLLATIYHQRNFPDEALEIAVDAIPQCPRRYRLYAMAGLAEFDRGRLAEALVWWSRSVVAQCAVMDFQEYRPFLHLAHTAEIIDARREADMFFTMTDAMADDRPRLQEHVVERLAAIRGSWVARPLARVLQHLDQEHLHGS